MLWKIGYPAPHRYLINPREHAIFTKSSAQKFTACFEGFFPLI